MEGQDAAKPKVHPADKTAADDAILARAHAIKRKRGDIQPSPTCDAPYATHAKRAHWDYVLTEASWLCTDMRQERLWKRKMAFLLAHEIAHSHIRLRPVGGGDAKDADATAPASGSRRPSRHKSSEGAADGKGKAGKGRNSVVKDAAANGTAIITPQDPSDVVLQWAHESMLTHSVAWRDTVKRLVQRRVEGHLIRTKLEAARYDEEWQAAKAEYVAAKREVVAAQTAQERAARPRPRDRPRAGGMGVDENAFLGNKRMAKHPGFDGMAPGMPPGAYHRMGMPGGQDWTSEDDRLLCCLMTEFSENMGLVADVYISTRRLEGMFFDLATTMERIRNIAKERQDCPVAKDEARSFLQQSIPCSASMVLRLQRAVQPIAEHIVKQAADEQNEAAHKRAELKLLKQPKAEAQMRYITQALAQFGGVVPSPRTVIAELRERRRQQQQGGAPPGGSGVAPQAVGAPPPQGGQPPPQGGPPPAQQGAQQWPQAQDPSRRSTPQFVDGPGEWRNGGPGAVPPGGPPSRDPLMQGAEPPGSRKPPGAADAQPAGLPGGPGGAAPPGNPHMQQAYAQQYTQGGPQPGGQRPYSNGVLQMPPPQQMHGDAMHDPAMGGRPMGAPRPAGSHPDSLGRMARQGSYAGPSHDGHALAAAQPPQAATAGLLQSYGSHPHGMPPNGAGMGAMQRRSSRGPMDSGGSGSVVGGMGASMPMGAIGPNAHAAHTGHRPP